MLKELFETVIHFARQGITPRVLKIENEPAHVYCIADSEGKLEFRESEPQPRNHRVRDLEGIMAWAENKPAAIWYSRSGVCVLLDDLTRRDIVRLDLSFHPQLLRLKSLENGRIWLDQKSFIALLRIDLDGCIDTQANLIDIFRRIRFRKQEEGSTVVLQNKASLGRAIEAEMSGSGAIPEEILLTVPVFDGAMQYPMPIRCALEADPAQEKFQLVPFVGQIEKAVCMAENAIGRTLRSELGAASAIFYGSP